VWFFFPETAGKSLKGMDKLFNLPWTIIIRKGAKLTEGKGSVPEAMARRDVKKIAYVENERATTQQVENVEEVRRS
jgi:hypothetical protein